MTTFLNFFKDLEEGYPNKLTVLVLDNARIHYTKLVKEFLCEEEKPFHFIFLPPYSP
ncbi:transposase [Geobacillus stearothermophilus]|nr:transposase [Geobacillus stearothermophilus]